MKARKNGIIYTMLSWIMELFDVEFRGFYAFCDRILICQSVKTLF